MKAKSLLLTGLLVGTGLTFLSLPAGAECWMTCPPGSTATPSSTGKQGATATTEPEVSPEERTPAKEPETAAKEPKAVPTATGATTEQAASPEELTQAKKPEATAKSSPNAVPAKPMAVPTAGPAMKPPPVQSTTPAPAPAPTQDAVAPSTPPLPPQGNAAFQPAPAPSTVPAPVPIPGVVPGTSTMHVIPE